MELSSRSPVVRGPAISPTSPWNSPIALLSSEVQPSPPRLPGSPLSLSCRNISPHLPHVSLGLPSRSPAVIYLPISPTSPWVSPLALAARCHTQFHPWKVCQRHSADKSDPFPSAAFFVHIFTTLLSHSWEIWVAFSWKRRAAISKSSTTHLIRCLQFIQFTFVIFTVNQGDLIKFVWVAGSFPFSSSISNCREIFLTRAALWHRGPTAHPLPPKD